MLCTKNAGQGRHLEAPVALKSSSQIPIRGLQVVQWPLVAH